MRGTKGDAMVLKPTCMTSVPVSNLFYHINSRNVSTENESFAFVSYQQLILDRISKGINGRVNGQAPLQKSIFKFAYDYKKIWTQRGYETPILDK